VRLYSDVPVGCFLSGGVDSSAVVAMMKKCSTGKIKTFSIGFPEKKYDETVYAKKVASLFNTEHYEFTVQPKSIEILPDLVKHYGEPFADSSALPTWFLSEMTRKHVTVVLTGDGGDESFAGYGWYLTGMKLAQISRWFPQRLAECLFMGLQQKSVGSGIVWKIRRLMQLLACDSVCRFAELRTDVNLNVRRKLYTGALLKRLKEEGQNFIEAVCAQNQLKDVLDSMLASDVESYLVGDLLVKVDRATMAHSLEARSPLLDHKFMEFAAQLPTKYKLQQGRTKSLLIDTILPYFPKDFFDRPKQGFSVPLRSWFCGDLKNYVSDRILNGKLAQSNLIDVSFVSRVLKNQESEVRQRDSLLWKLLILSEWLEIYC
jgi:asparagine synthase (glutamine-hydrolysing)